MRRHRLLAAGTLAAWPLLAAAQIGNPNDLYVTSDANHEVYQFERNAPWNHVPGAFAGSLGGAYSQVFSNNLELLTNSPYLGAVAGSAQNFFIGGFNGVHEIDSLTGARVQTIALGLRLGPALAPNGNLVVGGPVGTEEYDSNTGNFVRTINGAGGGANLFTFKQNEMFVANWSTFNNGFGIQRYDFITGLPSNPTIPTTFAPQEIAIGPDGALYATALYEGPGSEGMYRYDFGSNSWSHFINTSSLTGGGPHGFTFDPLNYDIYMAFNTGEIHRFDVSGNYLNQINFVPTKLTDILFKRVVPEPGTLTLLALAAVVGLRRRGPA
jgi:hypothetical protein